MKTHSFDAPRSLAMLALLALVACDSTVPADYDTLEGAYDGPTQGTGSGLALTGNSGLVAFQEGPGIDGIWALDGQLCFEDAGCQRFARTMEWDGVVAEGRNPKVSVDLDDGCGGSNNLSGTYITSTESLVLTGVLKLYSECRDAPWTITTSVTATKWEVIES